MSTPLTPGVARTSYNPFAQYELPGGLRKFTNAKLQSAIDDAIASAGDAHFVAVAHHEFDQSGVANTNVTKISALVRTSDGKFTLAVGAYKDWTAGDLGAEAKVVWKPF
jgi:hypothetical protein